ncbi:MAG TPA: class I SAM-dependent methyltransferase [Burkholderiales bacterium]|nr:class I SAM-dependent methyltransferase [Burkholderiales bacterium]
MKISRRAFQWLLALCFVSAAGAAAVLAQDAQDTPKPFVPFEGQEGKDVVWVPTPGVLVEKMLDLAKVTPQDYVMDLGSGDGRNIIAAARRGARALGVEYNPDMVELSRREAEKQGVADKAQFVQGDMYEADISQATVMALFLLPDNLEKLTPKFLDLKPGSRMVLNGFAVPGWEADVTERAEGDCGSWCTAMLYIVPARVAGTWRLPQGELRLEQKFQMLTGTLTRGGNRTPIKDGRLRGEEISFMAGGTKYVGRVKGDAISGANGTWTATRIRSKLQ